MGVPQSLSEGELVAGKYRLTRLLGRGGMGSVWEGIHFTLGTHVAVKFIEAEYSDSAEARQRFENEARAAAKLASKHVVQVFDHGLMADGRPYIVMEYLTGEPLDQRLARVGRLSLSDTSVIVTHVCRALTKAHEAGIVHRDLKPENVFLVRDEEDGTELAKVVDFGIAKFMDASGGLSSSTKTGSVLGTPYFMSPEQARGLRSIDHRSDLWSIAVIAYRCLIGELPFQGEAMGDLLVQICTAPLPVPSQRVPGLPPALDAWFSRALAREPAQRFQHAHELAESLAQIAGAGRAPAFSAATLEAALASAPTVAGAYDSGRLAGPAEGVTGAPFVSQSQGRPKRPASIGLIVGIGAGTALFLLIGALVLVLGRKGSAAEAPITAIPPIAPGASAPESSAVVVAAPPSAVPTVEPALAPPPSAGVSANPEISDQPHVGKTLKTFKGSGGGTGKPPTSGKGGTDIGY